MSIIITVTGGASWRHTHQHMGNWLHRGTARGLIQYKDVILQYRKSHCGDKTVVRSSYLHNAFPILVRWRLYIESGPRSPETGNIDIVMTSSNGNIFCIAGHLWGEFTGDRWIPLTKAIDAEFWCFLSSAPWINTSEAGDVRHHRTHMTSL